MLDWLGESRWGGQPLTIELVKKHLALALCLGAHAHVQHQIVARQVQAQGALMATSNSPARGHPKFPQAGRPDYDDSGVLVIRAAASLSL